MLYYAILPCCELAGRPAAWSAFHCYGRCVRWIALEERQVVLTHGWWASVCSNQLFLQLYVMWGADAAQLLTLQLGMN